ncbi:Protein of unknown function [Gryllus bimaculatus]|nr:Protein of unknown function [Gryllus bimaculatus]
MRESVHVICVKMQRGLNNIFDTLFCQALGLCNNADNMSSQLPKSSFQLVASSPLGIPGLRILAGKGSALSPTASGVSGAFPLKSQSSTLSLSAPLYVVQATLRLWWVFSCYATFTHPLMFFISSSAHPSHRIVRPFSALCAFGRFFSQVPTRVVPAASLPGRRRRVSAGGVDGEERRRDGRGLRRHPVAHAAAAAPTPRACRGRCSLPAHTPTPTTTPTPPALSENCSTPVPRGKPRPGEAHRRRRRLLQLGVDTPIPLHRDFVRRLCTVSHSPNLIERVGPRTRSDVGVQLAGEAPFEGDGHHSTPRFFGRGDHYLVEETRMDKMQHYRKRGARCVRMTKGRRYYVTSRDQCAGDFPHFYATILFTNAQVASREDNHLTFARVLLKLPLARLCHK